VTNDGKGLDSAAIAMWAEQIAHLRTLGKEVVLVSSGAIAEGMDLPRERALAGTGLAFDQHRQGAAGRLVTEGADPLHGRIVGFDERGGGEGGGNHSDHTANTHEEAIAAESRPPEVPWEAGG